MKREIQISRKTINSIVLLVVVIALIGAGFLLVHRNPALLSRIFTQTVATPTQVEPKSAPDAQAAAKALTAFYTLDYTEPVDQWQGRVCALTTPDGASSSRRSSPRQFAKWSKPTRSRRAARSKPCAWSKTKVIPAPGYWRSPWINPGQVRNPPCRYTLRSPRLTGTGYSTASCLTRKQLPASPPLH